jgi:hypothetical protein
LDPTNLSKYYLRGQQEKIENSMNVLS